MSEFLLKLENVSVTFGALRAVDGVSLQVSAGERRAILGPNGAGKTTLFNAIAGEIQPSAGNVTFLGKDVTQLKPHAKARLGIGRTYQITNLFNGLSVEDNLCLAVRGLSPRKFSVFESGRTTAAEQATIEQALADCGMGAKRDVPIRALSHGEQRQLELALALATKPSLLLLDEPAAGLSPAERGRMAEIIGALPRDLTLILIEHDMDLALGLVDFVTCLHYGQVLVEDSPDAIRNNEQVQEVYLGKPHHA